MIKMYLANNGRGAHIYEVIYDEFGKEKSVEHLVDLCEFDRVLMVIEEYDNCSISDLRKRLISEDESLRLHNLSIETMKESADAVLYVANDEEKLKDPVFGILTEAEMTSALEKGDISKEDFQTYKKIGLYGRLYGKENVIYADGYFNAPKLRVAPVEWMFATSRPIIRTDVLRTAFCRFPNGINERDHWDSPYSDSEDGITMEKYQQYFDMFNQRFKAKADGYVDGNERACRAIIPRLKY